MLAIRPAQFPQDRRLVETLFREYQNGLGFELDFQSFDKELAALPGKYAPPDGQIVIAYDGEQPVGCVAWYKLEEGICEVKRLYVRPECRGKQAGKQLFAHAVNACRAQGYRALRLDSLERLTAARKLYEHFAFRPIAPYNVNPFPDVYYLELTLV